MRRATYTCLLAVAVAVAACSDATAPRDRSALRASVDRLTLGVGDTVSLDVTRVDAGGREALASDVQWRSLDVARLTVDAVSGRVVARDTGDAALVVSSGDLADTVAVRVTRRVAALLISGPDSIIIGASRPLSVVALEAAGDTIPDAAVRWQADEASVAWVSSTGTVGGYVEGTASIRASAGSATATHPVRIRYERIVFPGVRPVELVMGQQHGCVLDEARRAWCWGSSDNGRVGQGTRSLTYQRFGAVVGDHRFVRLDAQDRATCGLTAENRLLCWGGNSIPRNAAQPTGTLDSIPSRAFAVGMHNQACAIAAADGVLRCWGHNDFHQLGRGPVASYDTLPAPVESEARFREVSVGIFSGCGLSLDDRTYCWGYMNDPEYVRRDTLRRRPVEVAGAPAFQSVHALGVAGAACGLTATGEAWCWGEQLWGQSTDTARIALQVPPTRVPGNHTFVRLDAGWDYACGLTAGGEIWCWGNYRGQPWRFAPDKTFRLFAVAADTGICGVMTNDETICVGITALPRP